MTKVHAKYAFASCFKFNVLQMTLILSAQMFKVLRSYEIHYGVQYGHQK